MDAMYLDNWSGRFDMIMDFSNVYMTEKEFNQGSCPWKNVEYFETNKRLAEEALADPDYDVNILLAHYETGNYEGSAFVLFEKDGKLFEVNASHCSCYGLEGQWNPEETTVESLRHRLKDGSLGRTYYDKENLFADELTSLLDVFSSRD